MNHRDTEKKSPGSASSHWLNHHYYHSQTAADVICCWISSQASGARYSRIGHAAVEGPLPLSAEITRALRSFFLSFTRLSHVQFVATSIITWTETSGRPSVAEALDCAVSAKHTGKPAELGTFCGQAGLAFVLLLETSVKPADGHLEGKIMADEIKIEFVR